MRSPAIVKKKGYVEIPVDLIRGKTVKKAFPLAKWSGNKTSCWRIRATDENIEKVNKMFGVELQTSRGSSAPVDVSRLKTRPYDHQTKSLRKCGGREFFGYFLTMGLGKTKITIDDAMLTKVDAVLVVCPKSVIPVWKKEVLEHSHAEEGQITLWPNTPGPLPAGFMQWFVINYDAVITDQGFRAAEAFLLGNSRTMVVCDESTVIKTIKRKGHKALRNSALMKLKPLSNYRRILTGTPMDAVTDLYGQLNWLDETVVGGRNFFAFRNHFCIMGGYKGKQVVDVVHKKELRKILDAHSIRIKLEDAIDLPEKTYQTRYIKLGKKSMALYEEVAEQLVVDIDDNKITMAQAVARLTKLQQITGGIVKADEGPVFVGTEKIDAIKDILAETERLPCLIWCQYTEEIKAIRGRLKKKYKVKALMGQTQNRGQIVEEFEAGDIDILILQNDTGRFGLTLTRASLSIYYSNSLSSITREQSEYRNYRIGQVNNVLYLDIVCKDRVDEHILGLLRRKSDLSKEIVDVNGIKELI